MLCSKENISDWTLKQNPYFYLIHVILPFFSGNEYTSTFGSNRYDGNLTQFIHDCFQSSVKSCILDGEMIGYDAATKTFGKVFIFDKVLHQKLFLNENRQELDKFGCFLFKCYITFDSNTYIYGTCSSIFCYFTRKSSIFYQWVLVMYMIVIVLYFFYQNNCGYIL